jgi:DNA-binding transcriptional MerR regulator
MATVRHDAYESHEDHEDHEDHESHEDLDPYELRVLRGWSWRAGLLPLDSDLGGGPTLALLGNVSRQYQVHEFAGRAGVTVKTLHHYDRVGLLRPQRTASGYRLYTDADLERLEQIVALKFIGLPLEQIKTLLDRDSLPLPQALRLQRQVLEDKRTAIDRAIAAIGRAEADIGAGDRALVLKKLIEVIAVENSVDVLKKYFAEASWPKWRRYFEQWPSPEWQDLFRDAEAALGSDPASDQAQALVERWKALLLADVAGDAEGRAGMMRALAARREWPAPLRDRLARFDLDAVNRFVNEAAWSRWDGERRKSGYGTAQVPGKTTRARLELFDDIEGSLAEPPSSAAAQSLLARWEALLDADAGGDGEARTSTLEAWSRRHQWPLGMRQWVAGLYGASLERWERVADFIDAARAAKRTRV